MISHFYFHMTLGRTVDCRVIGWRELGVKAVTIERIVVDGRETTEGYRDHLLQYHTHIYREIERKLGMFPNALCYNQPHHQPIEIPNELI